jgi:RHS repeat-associated protein
LLSLTIGCTYRYIHTDALGTPQRVTDRATQVVWEARYDPYGAATVNSDPDGNGQHVTLNLRFAGQYFDSETGLHQNWHRTYDPSTGRYLEPDPIGLAGGLNRFAYVGGNPVNAVDPEGLKTCLLTTVGPAGVRDHAAIYTSRGGGDGEASLYDPAGAFGAANGGGSSEIVTGDAASIEAFRNFHRGQHVEATCKETRQEEEEAIIEAAANLPSAAAFQCAVMASSALSGQPSFPRVEAGTFWPGNLMRQVKGN